MCRPIVVLVSPGFPPQPGGLEVVVREQAHRLAERGADVTVVTPATRASGGGLRYLWAAIRRADVVHIHDVLAISCCVAAALCFVLRRPYVVTLHRGAVDHPSPVVRWVRRTAGRFVMRRAARLLATSGFVADAHRDLAPGDGSWAVLPHGAGDHSWDAHVDRLWEVYGSVSAVVGTAGTRVAVVTPHFSPSVGCRQSYTSHLVEALRDSDEHDVVVVTMSGARRSRVERRDGVLVVRLGSWFTIARTPVNPLWVLRLPRLLRRHGVDVVHAHSPLPFLADVATFAAGRTPVVLSCRSDSVTRGVGGPVDAVLGWYERRVTPRVLARAEVVAPGVDTARFSYAPDRGSPRVLYVGRIEKGSRCKGLHALLDAFAQVLERVPEAELHLVGSGDGARDLAVRSERLGLGRAVTFGGTLRGDELVEAYHESSVVVVPSPTESEPFGMTLVEAMACGRPVVGADVGSTRVVVRDRVDGLLTPPDDPAALAHAVTWLLLDPELRQEMGTAGRQAAETRWDWSHSTRRTLEVLRAAGATPESGPSRTRSPRLRSRAVAPRRA